MSKKRAAASIANRYTLTLSVLATVGGHAHADDGEKQLIGALKKAETTRVRMASIFVESSDDGVNISSPNFDTRAAVEILCAIVADLAADVDRHQHAGN